MLVETQKLESNNPINIKCKSHNKHAQYVSDMHACMQV